MMNPEDALALAVQDNELFDLIFYELPRGSLRDKMIMSISKLHALLPQEVKDECDKITNKEFEEAVLRGYNSITGFIEKPKGA